MGEPEAFLVLNADIMGDYPLLEFVEFHRKHPGEHSILATEVRIVVILLFTNGKFIYNVIFHNKICNVNLVSVFSNFFLFRRHQGTATSIGLRSLMCCSY